MKKLILSSVVLLSLSSTAANKSRVFDWFKPLEDQTFNLTGSEGCDEISISNVMYDFGAGANTPMIVIKSEGLNKELHLAGSEYHDMYREVSENKYTFKFKQGCDGEFFNGMCKTTFEITKKDDAVVSLKLVEKRTKFLLTVSKKVMKCTL
ncbi:MAG: hypothetical protein BM556_01730 [Bacteriovorax sp. MedPE-SWde]|nr:MAG: hypothetical protein BM556_01730 [Bacteriovorax sp. MedPE-SWde]